VEGHPFLNVQSLVFGNGTNGKLWRFTHLGLNRETRPRLGPSVASSLRHSPSVEHVTAASSPCHAPSRRRQPLDHPRQLGPCKFASAASASSARLMFYSTTPARREGSPRDPLLRPAPTMLTVLTVSSALVLTLIIRVPLRPSRENVISIPIVRRNVCARRRRLESARGFFAIRRPSRSHCGHSPHTNSGDLTRCRSTWSG
jgi:hypothetical protein